MAKNKGNKTPKAQTKGTAKKAPVKKAVVAAAAPTPIILKNDYKSQEQLDTTEAAEFLGCSVPLIYAMLRDGRLASKETIGNRIYVNKADLQALKDGKKIHPRNSKHKKATADVTQGSQVMLNGTNQVVRFEVETSAADYNLMSMVLAAQSMTVAEWLSKMVTNYASQAKESAVRVVSAGSGS